MGLRGIHSEVRQTPHQQPQCCDEFRIGQVACRPRNFGCGSGSRLRVEFSRVFAKGRAQPKLAVSVGCPTVLLIADPGFAAELAEQIADSLPNELADRVDPPLRCNIVFSIGNCS